MNYLYHDEESQERIGNESVYISLSGGCGIQYKTFAVALDAFMVNGSRTTKSEQREAIIENCKNHLSMEYTPCIINEYTTDTDYILSVGYVPTIFLDNIQIAFENFGISVFDIKPFASLLYKVINKDVTNQIVVNTASEFILLNSLGLIGWCKPDDFNSDRDTDLVKDYLISQSEQLYKINESVAGTKLVDISNLRPYLNNEYDGDINSCVIAALALSKQEKPELKGGINDVANKFRLIFNKGKD